MVWDVFSGVYDIFESLLNNRVYERLGEAAAQEIESGDDVLECACGTGAISVYIAPKCKRLTATDMSKGMLKQAEKKLSRFENVRIRRADILNIASPDGYYDKVVAGNVIHLLDAPEAAVRELMRVCKPGGKVIIPTYIDIYEGSLGWLVRIVNKLGANFKRDFSGESYRAFFRELGYENVSYTILNGPVSCCIAVIEKE